MNRKKLIFITSIGMGMFIISSWLVLNYLSAMDRRYTNHLFLKLVDTPVSESSFIEAIKEDQSLHDTETLNKYGYDDTFFKRKYLKMVVLWSTFSIFLFSLLAFVCYTFEKKSRTQILKSIVTQLDCLEQSQPLFRTYHDEGYDLLNDAIQKNLRALNLMKNAAEASQKNMTQNLQDIAHQIKTPLTSMSLMTELLSESNEDTQKEILCRLENQISRLSALTDSLLKLSTLTQPHFNFNKKQTSVQAIFKSVFSSLEYLAQSKSIVFDCRFNLESIIECDLYWTTEGFYNLIKNAIEHSVEGGVIIISHHQNNLYHEFIIDDAGNGFVKEDLPYLFNRFYRGKNAKPDSVGIGLSISKSIFEGQGGQLSAHNYNGHGRFHLKQFIS